MTQFTLGMVGPANPREFADYLAVAPEDLPTGLGGSPVNLLTRELLKRGRQITLFTLDPQVEKEKIFRSKQLTVCIGPYRPSPRTRALDFFAVERAYLSSAIEREKPDILHAQWTYEFALASQACGLPTLTTAHDAPINVLRHDPTAYRFLRTLMAWKAVRNVSQLVVVSPHVDTHLRTYHFLKGQAEIIPNGLPESLFSQASANRNGARMHFATVLNGWGNYKNGQAAIEAFALTRREIPDARLFMFGDGHGPGEIAERWARANKLHDGIEFVGMVPHKKLLSQLAENIDVLVHPALEEAQPMSIIEAMSLGIPVIGGHKSGGVPWTLDYGQAGILVDLANPEVIAAAMLELAQDHEKRAEWGMRGRELAETRYHISAVADAYEALYRKTLEAA
jgi:glycosyltransferase involved in cell wall biosynthesis